MSAIPRGRVVAWALWDGGAAAYNAVILTFVYGVYLTGTVGKDLPGPVDANAWLGYSTGLAGLLIALMAPVIGQRADAAGRRKRATGVWTILCVVSIVALFWVRPDYHWLAYGLVLLGFGSIFYELATVSYNAMLRQVSTPETMGRVSGTARNSGTASTANHSAATRATSRTLSASAVGAPSRPPSPTISPR